ncbi:MAG TPA: FtsX-like permease family protein [Tepidisphaeraceae bacterium]|nr:FtsX-like permease family protein [Tepidisphaeraceae bacterium]
MRVGHYLRLAARESRRSRGRMALFVGCIAVGVAAVVVVAGLSASVDQGVRAEGRKLLAADVAVEGRQPVPAELDRILAAFATAAPDNPRPMQVRRADVREFASVVLGPGGGSSALSELKAVSGGYPFYGRLVLDPPRPPGELLLPADAVVVAPDLLNRLGAKVGDSLTIGGAAFRVEAALIEEPDKLTVTFTLGPRVFISPEGLARTKLLDRGARVEYRTLLKLPDGATAADAARLERQIRAALPNAEFYRVRTFTEAQPALRRSVERIGRYLGLVGLLSLLVGGVGVAQVARAWLASRMDDIAVMRCLGARPREVVVLFLIQVVALALVASLVGGALGTGLHWMVPKIVGGLLPAELIRPLQPAAIARGVGLGIAVALIFTLPLLIGLRRIPPVRVFRRDAEPVRAGRLGQLVTAGLVLGGVWAAASLQAESVKQGGVFVGGLVAVIAVLALAAAGVSRLARLLPRGLGGVRLRHGLSHLARPGAATAGAIVALGLGVTFVFATRLVERHLTEQLRAELPGDAPSTFLLDVQPDQWAGIETILKAEGATGLEARPIVTARFSAIDGVPVSQLTGRDYGADDRGGGPRGARQPGERPRRWNLTREQRITYGPALPRGNAVTAGSFPSKTPAGVSIEENFARDLGVGVGSRLTLDVQGVPVELTVTSLRSVDWRTFGINFFLFAEPGPLDDAPQLRIAVARLPVGADLPGVQARIVRAFPNVTVIHVRDVMDKVLAVLQNLALAVRSLGLFVVVAGTVVLGGTIVATQARRAREVALLKAVGMTRLDVAAVFAIEYALTGAVAAVVGLAAAAALAWAVLTQVLELQWSPGAVELAAGAGATVALAVVAGLLASARALAAKPVEVLRAE